VEFNGRRFFLSTLIGSAFAGFAYITARMLGLQKVIQPASARTLEIETDLISGITFFDEVIACKSSDRIRFFSSKCPHLGCKITKEQNGEIVCPCHGSRFSAEGRLLSGPAKSSLSELQFSFQNNRYIVNYGSEN